MGERSGDRRHESGGVGEALLPVIPDTGPAERADVFLEDGQPWGDRTVLESCGLTDVGLHRTLNEDSYVIDDGEVSFFAVCDGLGGQNAGEVASQLAVATLTAFIRKSHRDRDITWPYGLTTTLSFDGNRLLTAISLANKKVYRAADGRPDYTGLGTTVVAALISDATLTVGWVGDSRAYLVGDGSVEQLTTDHTWVNMARQEGTLSPADAEKHPWKHVLTRALGSRESVQVDLVERRLQPGVTVLLCSDGLTAMVSDQEIQRVVAQPAGLDEIGRELVAAANAAGGKDNITVILARWL